MPFHPILGFLMDLGDFDSEDDYDVVSLSSNQSDGMEFEESEDVSESEATSAHESDEDYEGDSQAHPNHFLTDTPLLQRLRRPPIPLPDTQESSAGIAAEVAAAVPNEPAVVSAASNQQHGEASTHTEPNVAVASVSTPKDNCNDEDGQICTICFEPWTNMSDHRLVSLRCGHLFGRSCITRWLKSQNRCPQCNARARKSEIRNIYAKAVKVIDSSERDKALQDLMKETELRRKAEITATQERLKHMMAVQECERLKKDLMEANRLLKELRSNSAPGSTQSKKVGSCFKLEKCIDIAKFGGCRIVDSSNILGMILVSQPSTNQLFDGYGFRKISTVDMKPAEYVLIHQKPIRDMAFHLNDGLVLTAALDKSLKITNVLSNSVVQTYNVESDAWSCVWDSDNPVYFYGGLRTGEVYVYDIRVTDRHVYQLPRFGANTPVVSIQYLNRPNTGTSRLYGPIVGKLSDCALQQKTEIPGFYKICPLPSLGPLTSLSSGKSGTFLISCRPSSKQPFVTHTLCEMANCGIEDYVCNALQTVTGGKSQVQLTRSKLLPHPEYATSVLICAGDEEAHGAFIWDGSSGSKLDHLRTDSCILDFAGLKLNSKSYVTALTDKTLRVYSWSPS